MKGKTAVICAFLFALLLKSFVFDFMIAQGNSMEPAIKDGAVLVINRMRYGVRLPFMRHYFIRWAQPKEGEIIVFYTPSGELAVKRCASLAAAGSFYAEGDNKAVSYDSRSYGPVSFDSIVGKVLNKNNEK